MSINGTKWVEKKTILKIIYFTTIRRLIRFSIDHVSGGKDKNRFWSPTKYIKK